MRVARRWSLATGLAALAIFAAGCGAHGFRCEDASDCVGAGAGAQCEATGHCSVADPTCDSGRRYAEHGGDLAGTCVPSGVAGTEGDTTTITATSTSTSTAGTTGDSSTGAITVTEASLTSADSSTGVVDSSGEVSTGPMTTEDSATVSDSESASSDESSTGTVGHGGEQCSACLADAHDAQCMEQLNACSVNGPCIQLGTCIAQCIEADDPDCAAACCVQRPESAVYEALAMCDLDVCGDVCSEFAVICGG